MRVNGRVYTYGPISGPPPVISARFLSEDERLHIADLHRLGRSIRTIARKLGRARSTISREVRRNADPAGGAYQPYAAHRARSRSLSPVQTSWPWLSSCGQWCKSCSTAAGAPNRSVSISAAFTRTNPKDTWCRDYLPDRR